MHYSRELLLGRAPGKLMRFAGRIAGRNAICIQIRKLIYRRKCVFFPLFSSLLCWIRSFPGSGFQDSLIHPTLPKQYSICTRTSAEPLCPLPSFHFMGPVIQFDLVLPRMYVRDFIQWGSGVFFSLLCYATSGFRPQRGNFCLWAVLNSGKTIPRGFNE